MYFNFKDEYFHKGNKQEHNRLISRAVIINDQNEIFFEEITRNDAFGNATYIETPGGGINLGETLIEGVKREVNEECALKVEVIKYLGVVEDDYNLINRHNITHYFLCKIVGKGEYHRDSYENDFIKNMIFIPFNEALIILSSPKSDIEKIVYRREKAILSLLEGKL